MLETKRRADERERLQARLITAEQDERRRLALFLHDGPLQSLAGIALMHDAALEALAEGRTDDARGDRAKRRRERTGDDPGTA